MFKCSLCLSEENYPDTGSHVVPDFLIRTMLNPDGKKRTANKDVSFAIGEASTKIKVGSAVDPAKHEELIGKELTDENIEDEVKKPNQYTCDEIWCTTCEKRFGVIENHYRPVLKFHHNGEQGSINEPLAKLFWYSILWRIAASKWVILKMSGKELKSFRYTLDQCLDLDLKNVVENIKTHEARLNDLAYKLFYVGKVGDLDDEKGTWVFPHSTFNKPYAILLYEHLLICYAKRKHINVIKQSYFDFDYDSGLFSDYKEDGVEYINFIESGVSNKLSKSVAAFKAEKRQIYLTQRIKSTFKSIKGVNPERKFIGEVLRRVFYEDEDIPEEERLTATRAIHKTLDTMGMR